MFVPLFVACLLGIQSLPQKQQASEPEKDTATRLVQFQIPPNPLDDGKEDAAPNLSAQLQSSASKFDEAARLFNESREELKELWKNGKTQSGDGCSCECSCDCPDEARLRTILQEELSAFRTKYALSSGGTRVFSGGSSGGSTSMLRSRRIDTSGGWGGLYAGAGVNVKTDYDGAVIVSESPAVTTTTVQNSPPVQTKTALRTYTYRAADGCNHRVTEYSDGTKKDVVTSCPAKRPVMFPNLPRNR